MSNEPRAASYEPRAERGIWVVADVPGGPRRWPLAARGSDPAAPSRRSFLQTTCAVGAVAFGLPRRPTRPLDRIGIQLYTVRNEMARDVPRTLARLAELGYAEVEFAGYFDHSPQAIRNMLAATGLTSPAAHVGFDGLGEGWSAVLDAAGTIGHTYVVVPFIPQNRRESLDGYRRVAEDFNRAAAAAREAGLRFGYHNHAFEFEPLEGSRGFDVLLDECDRDLVEFEMDLYWIRDGGGDPFAYFEREPGRFPLVHVKDMDASGRMVDVGQGIIDFAAIFARSAQAGIRHLFVEHDRPGDAFDSARRSFTHLRSLP